MKHFSFFLLFFLATNLFAQEDKNTFQALKSLEGKWVGTINYTNRESQPINIDYSIRSNGSALVEQSNEGGIEMMTIFNLQNDEMLSTHYCGLQNRPVSELKENNNGVISLVTNHALSGLDQSKDTFVGSWKINLMNDNEDAFFYSYQVIGPDGNLFEAEAQMKRVK